MVYDAFGKLVAEYGEPQETFGSRLKYEQQDWQGSVRTVSNQNGYVISRTDHSAYGETIGAGVGLRSTLQGYFDSPDTRQGYGLTERDEATGLDHTWFRKNENRSGRWTSPDPYLGSMKLADPQSFNRYSYVSGDPINFVDPSGLAQTCFGYHYTYVVIDQNTGATISSTYLGFIPVYCWDNNPMGNDGGGGLGSGGNETMFINTSSNEKEKAYKKCMADVAARFVQKIVDAIDAYNKAHLDLVVDIASDPKIVGAFGVAILGALGGSPWAVLGGLTTAFANLKLKEAPVASLILVRDSLDAAGNAVADAGDCARKRKRSPFAA